MQHLRATLSNYLFVSLCGASLFEWPNFIWSETRNPHVPLALWKKKSNDSDVLCDQRNALYRPRNGRICNHGEQAKMGKSCTKANSPRCNWTSFTSKVLDLRWRASWQAAVTTLSMKSSAIWRSIWEEMLKNKEHQFWTVNKKDNLRLLTLFFM